MNNKEILSTLENIKGVQTVTIEYPPHTMSDSPPSFIIEMDSGAIYRFNSCFFGLCPIASIVASRSKKDASISSKLIENRKSQRTAVLKIQSIYQDLFGKNRNENRKHHLLDTLSFIHWSENKEMECELMKMRHDAKNGIFSTLHSSAIEEYLSAFYPSLKIRTTHLAFAYLIDPDEIWPTAKELDNAIIAETKMQETKRFVSRPWQEVYGVE